jgi:hypothetical protein
VALGTALAYIDARGESLDRVRRCALGGSMLRGNPLLHPTVMLRRSVLEQHAIRYRAEYIYAEDYFLWLELSRLGRLAALDEVAYLYRVSDTTLRSRKLRNMLRATLPVKLTGWRRMGLGRRRPTCSAWRSRRACCSFRRGWSGRLTCGQTSASPGGADRCASRSDVLARRLDSSDARCNSSSRCSVTDVMTEPPRLRFSIVTPSFNQARFIRRTIDSVLGQQGDFGLEYLVVDGGSADGTAAILEGYGSRLKWISEPDRGQVDAINKGLERCTGDVVGWLNSDDVLLPGALRRRPMPCRAAGGRVVHGRCRIIDEHDRDPRLGGLQALPGEATHIRGPAGRELREPDDRVLAAVAAGGRRNPGSAVPAGL